MKYLRRNILDIEVKVDKEFPHPEQARYPFSAITIWDSFTNHYYTLVVRDSPLPLQKVIMSPEWDVYYCNSEMILATNFVKLTQMLNPDTWEGFFSKTFDFPYICNRLRNIEIDPNLLSPGGHFTCKNRPSSSGLHLLDIVEADKKFKQRSSYSLKLIAEEENLPVKKREINIVGSNYTPEELADYNMGDVEVPLALDNKMQHIKRYVNRWQLAGLESIDKAMSNSIIVDTVMLREAKKAGILLPSKPDKNEQAQTESEDVDIAGGMVFEPIIGVHDWVADDDQSRFYPNLIFLLRMSPENISSEGTLISANGTRFIDNPEAFLPRIIRHFFKERDRIQAEKALLTPDNPYYWKLHEEDENAKFLLNSVAGVFGQPSFRLYEPRIIDSITTSGQYLMIRGKEYLESISIPVVYGDSVSKDTLIFIMDEKHNIKRIPIYSLFKKIDFVHKDGKEYSLVQGLFTLTIDKYGKTVWKPIKYVMRHATNKKMYNVSSSNRCSLIVTEDHSLMGFSTGYRKRYHSSLFNELDRMKFITPQATQDIKNIVSIKHIPRNKIISKNYPKELYEFMGLFIGDGSFHNGINSGKKNYYLHLATGLDTNEILEKVIIPLQKSGWINSYYRKKKNYNIGINGVKLCELFEEFRNTDGKKQIPEWLDLETEENICSFLRGIFESDGSITQKFDITFCNIEEKIIDKIRTLLWYTGISNSSWIAGRPNTYNGVCSDTHSIKINIKNKKDFGKKIGFITIRKKNIMDTYKIGKIKEKIELLDFEVSKVNYSQTAYEGFVYDIEVEDTHTFFANEFLAHNTDALHRKLTGVTNIEEAIKQGKEINAKLNEKLPIWAQEKFNVKDASSIKIVFEKVFRRIMYIPNEKGKPVKKRYAARLVYEKGKITDQIYIRGFETRRSDASIISKDLQNNIFKKILYAENVEEVNKEIITYIRDLIAQFPDRPLSEIAIPCGFSKDLSAYGGLNKNGGKKGLDPEVRGAIYSNTHLFTNFGSNTKAKMLYINKIEGTDSIGEPLPHTEVIVFEDEAKLPKVEVNYEKMIDATVRKKIERILSVAGIDWNQIVGEEQSMFNF